MRSSIMPDWVMIVHAWPSNMSRAIVHYVPKITAPLNLLRYLVKGWLMRTEMYGYSMQ